VKPKVLVLWLIVVCSGLGCPEAYCAEKIRFGIVPQQSAAELAKLWVPLLGYLQEKSGLELVFETAKDIPTFEKRLAAGEYDVGYMNPYHYIVFHTSPGYTAFAREKGAKLQGVIVVRKDSNLNKIEELAGKTLAFPAPAAFAATILPLAHLKSQGITVTPSFTSSHDSVYMGVARGFFPAGGGINRTFENAKAETRDELRVLWMTPQYTPHALAAHPRVPKESMRRLQAATLGMDADPRGREVLARLNFKGFEEGRDADWDDIRRLGIRVLENVGKNIARER
jgi:phosphonate transport system substrate-binding protein